MTATFPAIPAYGSSSGIPPRPRPGPPAARPDLSDREVEVLIAWLASDSKREVTERLFLADSTVSTYIQRVRAKYEAAGRPARTKVRLLLRAVEDGYVRLGDL